MQTGPMQGFTNMPEQTLIFVIEGEHTASGSAMPVSDRSGTYFVLGL